MSIQSSIQQAEQIDGWMRTSELIWLSEQAAKANTIIEVGSYKGKSTKVLCESTPGVVFSIDPFEECYYDNNNKEIFKIGDAVLDEFNTNMNEYFLNGKLIHFRKTFNQIPYELQARFIFIDGDHRYYSVKEDIIQGIKHLEPGGIISGHDYGDIMWPGVKQAVDQIFEQVNITDTIWWKQL